MANVFTKAGRWLAGAWNGYERKNPSTGEREFRHFGEKRWNSAVREAEPKPYRTNASQHPRPPRQLVARASRAIGTGRIGVGEAIGTNRGTELETRSPTTWFAGAGGMIGVHGMGEIAGADEAAEQAVGSGSKRGGARGGNGSGS